MTCHEIYNKFIFMQKMIIYIYMYISKTRSMYVYIYIYVFMYIILYKLFISYRTRRSCRSCCRIVHVVSERARSAPHAPGPRHARTATGVRKRALGVRNDSLAGRWHFLGIRKNRFIYIYIYIYIYYWLLILFLYVCTKLNIFIFFIHLYIYKVE